MIYLWLLNLRVCGLSLFSCVPLLDSHILTRRAPISSFPSWWEKVEKQHLDKQSIFTPADCLRRLPLLTAVLYWI